MGTLERCCTAAILALPVVLDSPSPHNVSLHHWSPGESISSIDLHSLIFGVFPSFACLPQGKTRYAQSHRELRLVACGTDECVGGYDSGRVLHNLVLCCVVRETCRFCLLLRRFCLLLCHRPHSQPSQGHEENYWRSAHSLLAHSRLQLWPVVRVEREKDCDGIDRAHAPCFFLLSDC